MCNLIAFAPKMMGDIMYFHKAMQHEDSDQFMNAIVKEVIGHNNQSSELMKVGDVPVWAMRKKKNLVTNEITKYKARLNIHRRN